MKKDYLIILIFLMQSFCYAQTRISGKILSSKNIPLEGASVYLNNTSVGTTTDHNGNFELDVREGLYELIVSYVGFQTRQYVLDSEKYNTPILIKLRAKANLLDEVVVSSNKKEQKKKEKLTEKRRAQYLAWFTSAFIGRTKLSKNCKILNPTALYFDFDNETKTLSVTATEPLKIINRDLGYKISYDLVHFEASHTKNVYLGYTRYEQMNGSKREQKKWHKNRKKAYLGSIMHFVRSLRNMNFRDEGFVVDQFKKELNPNRPHDSIILKARKYIKEQTKKGVAHIDFGAAQYVQPKTKLDSAYAVLSKASRISKYNLIFTKKDLDFYDLIIEEETGDKIFLKFKDYLRIRYMNEKEELGYRRGRDRLKYQESVMYLLKEQVTLDKTGAIINPLDLIVTKYWSYLKFANTLPLDYSPK